MSNSSISSSANERMKRLVRLRDRAYRDREGVFVVEGDLLFDRARASGLTPLEVYTTPGHRIQSESIVVEPEVLDRVSYRNRSQDLIAVFENYSTPIDEIHLESHPLILVAESVEKPGNLGAMLRTADAVGATALITTGSVVDIFNPNVIRSSIGAIFSVPYTHAALPQLVDWLKQHAIELVAAVPGIDTAYWSADLTESLAILVGSEDTGLSNEARNAADRLVSIPMSGTADSLNVSVSAALLVFEARRQRSSSND